jgi:hypothetical protein
MNLLVLMKKWMAQVHMFDVIAIHELYLVVSVFFKCCTYILLMIVTNSFGLLTFIIE